MQGPNVKRLIVHKMSLDMVPSGSGLASAIEALTTPGSIGEHARKATDWVTTAITLVRQAAEPNPWKTADDEAIAGEILRGIESRKARA